MAADFEAEQREMRARTVLQMTERDRKSAAPRDSVAAMRQMKAAPALLAALKRLREVNMQSVARNRSKSLKAAIAEADAAIAEAEQ